MIKKLSSVEDGLGLVLPRDVLDLLAITADTPLEVKTDGESIIIRPARTLDRSERLREAAQRMMQIHAETLRELAK